MSYKLETWSKWLPHEYVILPKFHDDWAKTADFLLIANIWACTLFFGSPSISVVTVVKYHMVLMRWFGLVCPGTTVLTDTVGGNSYIESQL